MWIRIDDQAMDHPKFLAAAEHLAGRHDFARCWACWCEGMTYSARYVTDGRLPTSAVRAFKRAEQPLRVAEALVAAGLWLLVEGGYQVHDYEDYQPDAETVADVKEKRKKAGRAGGLRSGEVRRARQLNVEANTEAELKQVASISGSKTEAKLNPVPVPVPRTPASLEDQGSGGARLPARARQLVAGPDVRIRRYGRVNVWQSQHQDFVSRLGGRYGENADAVLDEFYTEVEARWQQHDEIPGGRPMPVWQREFDAKFSSRGSRSVNVGPLSREELHAARLVREKAWGRCWHEPTCATFEQCVEQIARLRREEGAA